VALIAALALAAPASAVERFVTTTADTAGTTCANPCSLRQAIGAANLGSGGDVIHVGAGTYQLGSALDVTKTMAIAGAGARVTVIRAFPGTSAVGDGSRVFYVSGAPVHTLTASGIRVTGGDSAGQTGGGIAVVSGNALALTDSTVDHNQVTSSGSSPQGGGIYGYQATISLTRATVAANVAGPRPLANSFGGGIATEGGVLTVVNSTITGNIASATGGDKGFGGGIDVGSPNGSVASIRNSTISGNTAMTGIAANDYTGAGGNLLAGSNRAIDLTGTIVSGGTAVEGANCFKSSPGSLITSGGHNFEDLSTCGLAGTGDLEGAGNPLLGTLGANGGPTDTRALSPFSPALNRGGAICPSTDQRGVRRPQGPACDIGAFELVPAAAKPVVQAPAPNVAPTISKAKLSKKSFRAKAKKPKKPGTTLTFTLSEAATVKLRIERAASGRRVAGKCKAKTRKNAKSRKCTLYRKLKGGFTIKAKKGKNKFRLTGKLRGKRLKAGRYRLVIGATDSGRLRAKTKRLKFRVLRAAR
jgi:CSLREA domain-containing protein